MEKHDVYFDGKKYAQRQRTRRNGDRGSSLSWSWMATEHRTQRGRASMVPLDA